ncbi:MAG: phosphoribosylanthranilate isomerase [Deltaproteobacteria bacterium]|nr:MAG: phosphoribosylanthranilate isomerase [Deltaproteobacteria bacterium]
MAVRIKVCGITNEEDALAASQLGAHALGFVFAPSPRRVSAERARKIIERLPPLVQSVGVFVDADPEEVASTAGFCRLDLLQFHGSESAAYCRRFECRVIKAIRIKGRGDLESIADYSDSVDALLLDTHVAQQHGGTGQTFDWNLALEAKGHGRIILAGGLNPENVADAVRVVEPYAVDASSGLEQRPGVKDHLKIARFIESVYQAARQ